MREAGIQQIIACIAERMLGNRIPDKQHAFYRYASTALDTYRETCGSIGTLVFISSLIGPDEPRYKAGKLD